MADYVTLAEAQSYFNERLYTEAWDEASYGNKVKAIKMATKRIDNLNYTGELADPAQENQFPRGTDTVVPPEVKWACCEIALALLKSDDSETTDGNSNVLSESISSVRVTYGEPGGESIAVAVGIPSAAAWRYLFPFIRDYNRITLVRG